MPDRGFLLNNELTDFNFTDTQGGQDPNLPGPGKRPRSSMSPTIVLSDGEPLLALGSPGGSTIITTVLQILVNRLDLGMDLAEAVAAPRATQRNTAAVQAEPGFPRTRLAALGHVFADNPEIGAATGIEFLRKGSLIAVAEPTRRGGGSAAVVCPRVCAQSMRRPMGEPIGRCARRPATRRAPRWPPGTLDRVGVSGIEPLRMGLIGTGRFGQFCLEQYLTVPQVEVVAVADAVPSRAAEVAEAHGLIAMPPEELLAQADVDLIYLGTPPSTHAGLSVRALEAGRHVICEKPLALDVASGRRAVEAADRAGRFLVVNLIMRYNPICIAVQAIMERRLLGEPLHASFENYAKDEDLPQRALVLGSLAERRHLHRARGPLLRPLLDVVRARPDHLRPAAAQAGHRPRGPGRRHGGVRRGSARGVLSRLPPGGEDGPSGDPDRVRAG